MKRISWQELLTCRDKIIGGQLETSESGKTFRGPIAGLQLVDGMIIFTMVWWARRDTWNKPWRLIDTTPIGVRNDMPEPWKHDNDTIYFALPMIGSATIYLKGSDNMLDRSEVDDRSV